MQAVEATVAAAEDSAVRRSLQAVEGQASEVRRALQALRTQVDGLDSANRWASVVFRGPASECSHIQTLQALRTLVQGIDGTNRWASVVFRRPAFK